MIFPRRVTIYTKHDRPISFESLRKTLRFAGELVCVLCKKDIEHNPERDRDMFEVRCLEKRFPTTYIHIDCVGVISKDNAIRSNWHYACVCLDAEWEMARQALKQWKCWLPTITI